MNEDLSSLLALDTETGGAGERQCRTHALLSVGIFAPPVPVLPVRDGASFEGFCHAHPGLAVDPGAVAVNGYSAERWQEHGAVPEGELLARAIAYLAFLRAERRVQRITLVAHNAGHDRGFMECALERHGLLPAWNKIVSHRWECSQAAFAFAQRGGLVPRGSASLDALTAARLNISLAEAKAQRAGHAALKDAQLCWAGYAWLLDQALFSGSPGWVTFPSRGAIAPATNKPAHLGENPCRDELSTAETPG